MRRKSIFVVSVILILFSLQSCQQKPEEGLLKRYFHAITLNDVTTMSSIALEPISIEAVSWDIVSASEERVEPATLAELNIEELDLKKKLEGHVGPTLDASDALEVAQDDLDRSRSAAAKRRVEELQLKYDQERELHAQLQKGYNDAKAAASREEEITSFSIARTDLANLRELSGEVHFKELELQVRNKAGEIKNYKIYMRKYNLMDEVINLNYAGRWIIVNFEPLT